MSVLHLILLELSEQWLLFLSLPSPTKPHVGLRSEHTEISSGHGRVLFCPLGEAEDTALREQILLALPRVVHQAVAVPVFPGRALPSSCRCEFFEPAQVSGEKNIFPTLSHCFPPLPCSWVEGRGDRLRRVRRFLRCGRLLPPVTAGSLGSNIPCSSAAAESLHHGTTIRLTFPLPLESWSVRAGRRWPLSE